MDQRDDQPEILEYTSRKQVQPSHESANRLLLLYSIPSTALLLLMLELLRSIAMGRQFMSLTTTLMLIVMLAPIAFMFAIGSFVLGKERGSGFPLWYAMIINSAAMVLILATGLLLVMSMLH